MSIGLLFGLLQMLEFIHWLYLCLLPLLLLPYCASALLSSSIWNVHTTALSICWHMKRKRNCFWSARKWKDTHLILRSTLNKDTNSCFRNCQWNGNVILHHYSCWCGDTTCSILFSPTLMVKMLYLKCRSRGLKLPLMLLLLVTVASVYRRLGDRHFLWPFGRHGFSSGELTSKAL